MEVKKISKKEFLLDLLYSLNLGLNPTKICDKYSISKQRLNYYLSSLKQQGLIKKIGYGTWEVKQVKKSTKDTPYQPETIFKKPKEIRGHAFIWKIKIPKEINGYNNLNKLQSKNISYNLIGLKKTARIMCLKKKVWLGNKNIIIYDSNSYFGSTACESKKYAVYRLLTIIQELEKTLKISLKTPIGYIFKPSRQHYSIIKNSLAIQCNKEGIKLKVDYYGETWFIIDNSYNLNEAETVSKENALLDNLKLQNYFNSHKKTDFKVTPEFILNTMNGIQQNQLIFAENMKSHISAIQELGNAVKDLRNEIKQNNINLFK